MHGTNLLPDPTSFIGREAALESLAQQFKEGARLISILGPGGAGKTRLARAFGLAALKSAQFEAVWFCDLSEASSQMDVVIAVAELLGLSSGAHADVDALTRGCGLALENRPRELIVLDNFEQVLKPAAKTVMAWSRSAQGARLLITSRAPLQLGHEVRHELEPLSPEDGARLFIERARVDLKGHAKIDEIVRKLDGLPLAIELAAARTRVLSMDALLAKLTESMEVLRARRIDVPSRHATLKAAIDHSWDLLSREEQRALVESAIFRGGFSLEAAEAVLSAKDVLDIIESLVEKSLLRAHPAQARFSMYESVRAYACDRRDPQSTRALSRSHAQYFASVATEQADRIRGPQQSLALGWLAQERDNLLSAHRFACSEAPQLAAQLALALDSLLRLRGAPSLRAELLHQTLRTERETPAAAGELQCALAETERSLGRFDEAIARLQNILAAPPSDFSAGKAEYLMGTVHHARRTLSPACAALSRAAAHFRAANAKAHEGEAIRLLGHSRLLQGDLDGARDELEEALEIAARVEDPWALAWARSSMGSLEHICGELLEARRFYQQARQTFLDQGFARDAAMTWFNEAIIDREEMDYAAALKHLDDGLKLVQPLADQHAIAFARSIQAEVYCLKDEWPRALRVFDEVFEIYVAIGDLRSRAEIFAYRGAHAALVGDRKRSKAMFAQADALIAQEGQSEYLIAAVDSLRALYWTATVLADPSDTEAKKQADALMAMPHAPGGPSGTSMAERSTNLRMIARLVEGCVANMRSGSGTADATLRIAADGSWFQPAKGPRVDLSSKPRLSAVLRVLAQAKSTQPDSALSKSDLLTRAWPQERVLPKAGANRVYVAVASLRALGLEGALVTRDGGYLLCAGEVLFEQA